MVPEQLSFSLPTLQGEPNPHRLVCWQRGDPNNPDVLVCVHGLTRQGRDFDFLAQALSVRYRVLCPDMPGRGESDRLSPGTAYNYGQYLSDLTAMLTQLGITSCDWVGTSMGGIIGMMMAATQPARIRKLVLNDVGSLIPKASLERLRTYVGKRMHFASMAEATPALREIFGPWGIETEEQWRHLLQYSLQQEADGSVRLRYDAAIAEVFLAQQELQDVDLKPVWEKVTCPVLILRGVDSDLLLHETAMEMASSRPGVKLVEIAGAGHAPHLMSDAQISLVAKWLDAA